MDLHIYYFWLYPSIRNNLSIFFGFINLIFFQSLFKKLYVEKRYSKNIYSIKIEPLDMNTQG